MTFTRAFMREHRWEMLIFILAIIVRTGYFLLSLHGYGHGDFIKTVQGADGYFQISQNLLAGHGFSSAGGPPYDPNSFRSPLWPYTLAASAQVGGYGLSLVLLIVMGSLVPLVAMRIARLVFKIRAIELAVGIFLALEPVSILFSIFFYSETAFTLFLLLAIYYFLRYLENDRSVFLFLSSGFLGIATLVRAASEYLPVIFIAVLLWHFRGRFTQKNLTALGVYVLIFAVLLSPWFLRNWQVYHAFGMTSEEGVTLYTVLVPSVFSLEQGTPYQATQDAWLATNNVKGPNEATIDVSSSYVKKAIPILLSHPKGLMLNALDTGLAFFTHDGVFDVLSHAGLKPDLSLGKPAVMLLFTEPVAFAKFVGYYITRPGVLILIMRIVWYVVTLLCALGVIFYIRLKGFTPQVALILGLILYFLLITLTIGLTVNARYRLPVESLLVLFALYGGLYLKDLWRPYR